MICCFWELHANFGGYQAWAMLIQKSFELPDKHSDCYWVTVGWPQKIGLAVTSVETRLAQQRVCTHF
jgi:hypothetical protein